MTIIQLRITYTPDNLVWEKNYYHHTSLHTWKARQGDTLEVIDDMYYPKTGLHNDKYCNISGKLVHIRYYQKPPTVDCNPSNYKYSIE